MTKLVFMGTPAFSATVLEGLLTDERYDIVAVVTQPDRAVGRKKEIQPYSQCRLHFGLKPESEVTQQQIKRKSSQNTVHKRLCLAEQQISQSNDKNNQ